MAVEPQRAPGPRSEYGSLATAFVYSLGMTMAAVAVPLLILEAGFDAFVVGLLVSLSAVSQLTARPFMPGWMRRASDRSIIVCAAFLLALACVVLLVSHSLWLFAISQLLQGVSRAFFWTASHTHAVRVSTNRLSGLGAMNLIGGLGMLAGPLTAGLVGEVSLRLVLVIAAGASLAVIPIVFSYPRLEPLPRRILPEGLNGDRRAGAWRNPGVTHGGWLNTAAGAHNSLVTSCVPVLLHAAGHGPIIVGWCIASGNVAVLAGMIFAARFYRRAPRATSAIAILAAGAGLAALGPSASWPVVACLLLAIAGLGAGTLQTLGPGIAAEAVVPAEHGDAITAVGTYRSVAMITAPAIASGLSLVLPLGAAVVLLGGGICTLVLARRPVAE